MHSPLFYSSKFVGEVHGEAVMKDRTRVLCDRTNTSAEKLDQPSGELITWINSSLYFIRILKAQMINSILGINNVE